MPQLSNDHQTTEIMKRIFITGISTEVGKTVVSAIVTEALEADYWKPIQAGDLELSDSHKVAALISNEKSYIHNNSYALRYPMSPHAAAALEGIQIDLSKIQLPKTDNHLVIEGAGGLLVPLNQTHTILDIIDPSYKVIIVSRHYLGSINHSLLTIHYLRERGFDISVIFNGPENEATESVIANMTGVKVLGRIDNEKIIDKSVIKHYAEVLKATLSDL